jgi:tetratricopeptide (TPR) repeat protein
MKKHLIIGLASVISIGCGGTAQPTPPTSTNNTNQTANAALVQASNTSTVQPAGEQTIVSSHSNTAVNTAPPSEVLTSTESPMARPIDVNQMTADIEKAEKEYKKNPATKDQLAKAYFVRATALTDAAQYRAALGDYRKGLKLEPNDEAAKSMHDEILRIFKSINREPPKEGTEPKPLPIK